MIERRILRLCLAAFALVAPSVLSAAASAQDRTVPRSAAELKLSFAPVVKRAAPAVVNVYAARAVEVRHPLFDDPMFRRFFGAPGNIPREQMQRSLGSGVIVDPSGLIITNNHVVEGATEVKVSLADKREFEAAIVLKDSRTDLAVLRIKDAGRQRFAAIEMGNSDDLQVGDVVLAIGNPIGLSQTVTHGIVSATSRRQLGVATFENFIQTDAPINFGNSGGALIDTNGELVGINTAIVAKNLGVEGIGFAIPVNMVRGVVGEIVAQGRVIRGWIGIVPEDVTQLQAAELGLPQGGVLVVNLYADGPAQRAGLQPGDLLTEIDGSPVLTAQDALAHVASRKPGQTIRIRGIRGRAPFEVTVTVAERPYSG